MCSLQTGRFCSLYSCLDHMHCKLECVIKSRGFLYRFWNITLIYFLWFLKYKTFQILIWSVDYLTAALVLVFFLCRMRSIAAHRDHSVRRLSVCPSVCLSGSNIFLVVMHSYVSQATHAFLGMLLLCFIFFIVQCRRQFLVSKLR